MNAMNKKQKENNERIKSHNAHASSHFLLKEMFIQDIKRNFRSTGQRFKAALQRKKLYNK